MAAPHPEDELARLQKRCVKGLPVVLAIRGPNDHFRSAAVDLVLAKVPADAELRIVDAAGVRAAGGGDDAEGDERDDGDADGGEASGEALAACPELQDLLGGGLFARTTVVVVRRAANWWKVHGATVAAVASRFQRGSALVVEAPALEKRKKAVAALLKQVATDGADFEFRDLYDLPFDRSRGPLEGELCKWVVRRANRLGLPLSPEAAWLLVLQIGKAPADLLAELDRLRAQFGEVRAGRLIGPDDLHGRLSCSFEATPFELADAVLGGDRRAALRAARALADRGTRGKGGRRVEDAGVLAFVTSWLHRTIATTLEGRMLLDSGVSLRDLPDRAGVRTFTERFVEQVRRNDLPTLRRGLLALRQCQRAARVSGEDAGVLLERFLATWFDGAPVPSLEEIEW